MEYIMWFRAKFYETSHIGWIFYGVGMFFSDVSFIPYVLYILRYSRGDMPVCFLKMKLK